MLKVGKLPEDIIEGMACEGRCINGPGKVTDGIMQSKKIFDKYVKVPNTEIIANSEKAGFADINIHKH